MMPSRSLRHVAALTVVLSSLAAQGPICLTTTYAGTTSTTQGCTALLDIVVTNPIAISSIDCSFTAASGVPVGLDVWVTPNGWSGNETNQGIWTLAARDNGTVVSAGPGAPTTFTFANPIILTPGTYGLSLDSSGATSHRYSSATAPISYSDANIMLNLGAIQATPFASGLLNPRHWNGSICYSVGSGFATAVSYGTGCGAGDPSSFYEVFTASGFDLSNTGFTMNGAGATYLVTTGATPIVTPVGTNLVLGDDVTVPVALPWSFPAQAGATNSIWLCSNGFISFETTTIQDLSESVVELLSGTNRLCPMWDDLNPAAGGTVHAEQDAVDPTQFHVTFTGVPEFSVGGSNSFQITLHQGGVIEVKYGACSVADCLVGYSRGGGVSDPGATDLSAMTAFVLGDDRRALGMRSVARPVIGTTATTQTTSIPPSGLAGVVFYGINPIVPGFDLTVLNMPGCFLHVSSDASAPFTVSGTTVNHSLAIPNVPALAGARLHQQSAIVAPGINPFGVVTSNGMTWTLGAQ